MRIWLYYRLSRDEDDELNSLNNQRQIIYDYAVSKGYTIAGESFDDNISGMHFNRAGIDKIYEAVENCLIDAVLVKDLSRLGRHRTQTALFIDYLRTQNVRVLSATENIDTFNENDDLLIGFKGLMNDYYARDGSRRVRAGIRQKQKNGMVIVPPFGYFKDKNTKEIVVVEDVAETVRRIYSLYLDGYGFKAIARKLNEEGHKTPAKIQLELLKKKSPNTHDKVLKKYLWEGTMVGRILMDESYTGTLICHKSDRNKINKTFRFTEEAEQYRHEDFLPVIIPKAKWQEVQSLIASRKACNVRASSGQIAHRYGGLLQCKDCGRTFIGKRVKLVSGERVDYVCDTYHRYGKEHCPPHTIHETILDALLHKELLACRDQYQTIWDNLSKVMDQWMPDLSNMEGKIQKANDAILNIENEVEAILLEKIRDKDNAVRYDRMIAKREEEISRLQNEIQRLEHMDETLRQKQTTLRRDIRLMDDILSYGKIAGSQLRLLVEGIVISEVDGKLDLEITLKAPFRDHKDVYEDSDLLEVIG
ncbi:recombinase family protein [Bengtsoniella intestinalis]|uniref:recombinase family protein n=1 Tax=Bengtsoniella intestinalis TaxID=3073143 RepID=UPI00391F206F